MFFSQRAAEMKFHHCSPTVQMFLAPPEKTASDARGSASNEAELF